MEHGSRTIMQNWNRQMSFCNNPHCNMTYCPLCSREVAKAKLANAHLHTQYNPNTYDELVRQDLEKK
jgi:hypothetical protein